MRRATKALAGVVVAAAGAWRSAGSLLFGRGRGAPAAVGGGSAAGTRGGAACRVFAEDIPNARFLRFTPAGDLLVSLPRAGRVVPLERDADGDGRSDGRADVADRPQSAARPRPPRGLALRRRGRRGRARSASTPRRGATRGAFERIVTGLPERREPLDAHGALRARTAGCTCRSARAATSASRRTRGARRCCATSPTAAASEIFATGLRNSRRLRLAARRRRALRHRQRPRPARRRLPALRAQPHRAGRLLRLALRERRPRARSRTSARGRRRASRRRSRRSTPSARTTRRSA